MLTRHAEIAPRHVFQFVGFVEDHGAASGQDAGIGRISACCLIAEVGEEQVMVDDDDVALHRPAVHLGDEAAVEGAAFLSEAGVGARIELVPERAGLGQLAKFGAVAGLRCLFPCSDGAIVLDLLQSVSTG